MGVVRLEQPLLESDSLRQPIRLEIEAHHILSWIGEVSKASVKPENKEDPGIVSKCDSGVAPLDPVQRRSAHLGAFGHERHGDSPSPPRIA